MKRNTRIAENRGLWYCRSAETAKRSYVWTIPPEASYKRKAPLPRGALAAAGDIIFAFVPFYIRRKICNRGRHCKDAA